MNARGVTSSRRRPSRPNDYGEQTPRDAAHLESFYVSGLGAWVSLDVRRIPSELIVHPTHGHGVDPASDEWRDHVERDLDWFGYWLRDEPFADSARQAEFDGWKRQHAHNTSPETSP
jgi:hypothetical protein